MRVLGIGKDDVPEAFEVVHSVVALAFGGGVEGGGPQGAEVGGESDGGEVEVCAGEVR